MPGGWKLVWQDEFDGESLDDAAWNIEEHAPGWVNNEDQRYVKGHDQPGSNIWVTDGTLIIEARKESNGDITSGRLNSKKKKDWLYGKFEARAILLGGNGTWPAIWTLSSTNPYGGWPKSGEIDIVEFLGKDPNEVHFTIHCDTYVHSKSNAKSSTRVIGTINTEYHTYGLEWGPDEIRGYVDGEQYFTFENENSGWQSWPYDSPFHWILNVAMGGWGGTIDDSTLPARMIVDYVRVWQQAEHMPEEIDGVGWTAISDFKQITQSGYVPFYKDTDRDVLAVNSSDYPDGVSLVEKEFSGDVGEYDVTIKTMTENDGESSYTLLVNGIKIGTFQNPEDTDSFNEKTFTWEVISLKKGDVIGLSFNSHTNKKIHEGETFAYARGRWKSITIARAVE